MRGGLTRIVAVIALGAVTVAGCTPSSSEDERSECPEGADYATCEADRVAALSDACKLILPSEAQRIIGGVLGIPGHFTERALCFNTGTLRDRNGAPIGGFDLRFELIRAPRGAQAFATATRGLPDRPPDLGDEARWDPRATTVHVLQGGHYLWVQLTKDAADRNKTIELARLGLGRTG